MQRQIYRPWPRAGLLTDARQLWLARFLSFLVVASHKREGWLSCFHDGYYSGFSAAILIYLRLETALEYLSADVAT
jgi:hypothetical protein